MIKEGQIGVTTGNIFPIIKKFLYSDHEIFLRELIANAVDATSKLKALANKGEFKGETGDLNIEVLADKEAGTLTIRDHGIGMDEQEMDRYLNQVAFSSAQEFLDKFKDDLNIIGHFGLGFYSAFMVSEKVVVRSLSWKDGAAPAQWSCTGDTDYTIESCEKAMRGTDVILHLNEESKEFLDQYKLEELLRKFCKFLPIPIQLGTRKESVTTTEGEDEKDKTEEIEVPNIINNTDPLWKKSPADLTDEQYKAFYQELYPYSPEPIFWIHLNIDYPFNLTGILYFPKIKNQFEIQKNKIHLYSNQVFVTDDVKEIVPEFLMMLHGVIDSPDIPLNVSRSYLQADSNVRKITTYITRKVAEKLGDLFKKNRSDYESKWDDIGTFIRYGIISDEKFEEKAISFALLKNTDQAYRTIDEYKEAVGEVQKDKNGKLIALYTQDPVQHHGLIRQCKDRGYEVLVMDQIIDNHFIQHLEYKADVRFKRIDSETISQLIDESSSAESVLSESDQNKISELFKGLEVNKASDTQIKAMSPQDDPVQIVRPEFMRRMSEMQRMMTMMKGEGEDLFKDSYTLIINSNHPVIAKKMTELSDESAQKELASYLTKLALLAQNMLKGEDLSLFIRNSIEKVS